MSEEQKTTYGLIGYPLGHSLSPILHNTAFEELGVDASYKLFPLKEKELDGFFKMVKDKKSEIFGFNVTVPYKEKALRYMDVLSPFTQKIKAVNTVVIDKERQLIGYNTDGPGFLTHLAELGFETKQKKISILGAGGAARAIVSILCLIPERPESILIYDVDKGRAEFLIKDLSERFDAGIVRSVHSIDDLNIDTAHLLINATPIGMKADDPCLVDEALLHDGLNVYDVIYNPAKTKLLKLAEGKGANISNGLGMLFYQGVLAFEHWADVGITEGIKEKMRTSLKEALES